MDALQQVRAEFRSEVEAYYQKISTSDLASDVGGNMPGSATDVPLVNNEGGTAQLHRSDVANYAIQCAYCVGSVPKSIAKHCTDCYLFSIMATTRFTVMSGPVCWSAMIYAIGVKSTMKSTRP